MAPGLTSSGPRPRAAGGRARLLPNRVGSRAEVKRESALPADQALHVLGVDPGLEQTGYAVIEMPGGRIREAGLIRSTRSRPLAARLGEIAEGVEEVVAENDVALLVVEDLFAHYKHPRTAILMGHARGVVLLAAARRGIEVVSVPATRIKKALTGNGHASKIQVQRAVMATLNLARMPEPSDVADALAIACYGAWRCRPRGRM